MNAADNEPVCFPGRATRLRLPKRWLEFGAQPLLMGIVNVTPDSFSDGGRYFGRDVAIEHALRLAEEGADLLDIGGESTRPYSTPVEASEELDRVAPVVEAVCRQVEIPVSVDTSKSSVAKACVGLGAEIINDITGLEGDPEMIATALDTGAAVCAMHMQGTPQTMQDNPTYYDVVTEIHEYLRRRRDALNAAGISSDRILLDPGVGFGKTHAHNIALAAACYRFHDLGCPLLVGHSRKGFIGSLIGDKQADRTAGGVGVALSLARQQVQVLRIHDVLAVRHALILFEATGGLATDASC